MSKLTLFLILCSSTPAFCQKLYVYPATVVAPRGTYQTITAVATGVNNKTVTWSASGGKLIGTNPCASNEPCTIALHTTDPGTYTVTATSNQNPSLKSSSTVKITPTPVPATTHPRLMVTAAMLPALRAKATSRNTVYKAIDEYTRQYYLDHDNGIWSWSCRGGTGLPSSDQSQNWRENDAYMFALLSMIAPTQNERDTWGCYGRDVWVYVMKQVISGKEELNGNHWSDGSPQLSLTTDWLIAGGYLNAADQALARQYLYALAKKVAGFGNGYAPPVTAYNSPSQFSRGIAQNASSDLGAMRAMGNNYTLSRMLVMAAVGLTFNDTPDDDPALSNTCGAKRYQVCPDFTAGSLHAYFSYFAGSMLYLDWAHLEDPAVTWQAYQAAFGNISKAPGCLYSDGTSYPCFGDGRGGESSEGSWYQYSMYRLRYALNVVHTAGYDDPVRYGPQISLGTSSWWDLKYVQDLEFLTGPHAGVPPGAQSPGYGYLTTGDSNSYYRMPSDFQTEASMLTADSYVGRTDRTEALRWLLLNTAFGGPLGTAHGCSSYCGFDSELMNAFAGSLTTDLFIALPAGDPVASLPNDPRPSLPPDLYNGSFNQHLMVRSGWKADDTLISFYCPNAFNDHEHEFCGRFDIFARGEYITKGRTEFNDYNDRMTTASQSNIASILNKTPGATCVGDCWMSPAVIDGGQFWHSQQQGMLSLLHSELPNYVSFSANTKPVYNGWWKWSQPYDVPAFDDVTAASRSMVYLRESNQLVIYNRAATRHESAKYVSQITTGKPTVSGNVASWMTRSGKQKAYLTTLLPAGAAVSAVDIPSGSNNQASDWEPFSSIRASAGTPLSARLLTVLEWGAGSLPRTPATLAQSSTGQGFDGARIGSALVLFMRDWPATFKQVSYPASGATTHYIAGLAPNATYSITGAVNAPTATADTGGILVFASTGSGDVTIAAGPR